jgi:dihydroorotase
VSHWCRELDAVLKRMRPGDIITHVYSGAGNNVIQDGKLMSAALQAQQRGVIMDVGHGATAFDFTIAQTAIAQGLRPDTISSDLHKPGITGPGKAFLPWVMSKFLSLGLSLDEVIRLASVAPAQIIGRIDNLGTLKLGATADIAVMTLVHEPVQFLDTRNNVRRGDQYLRPRQTFRAGQPCEDNSSRNYAYPA